MKRNELMEIVHAAYPEGLTKNCWDASRQRVRAGCGDTLAEFIVREIADTFEEGSTDRAQIADAVLVMNRAQSDLDSVAKALERRLERLCREDANSG